MPLSFDNSASGQSAATTTVTFSHTCAGNDRILLVFAGCHSLTGVSSVTYNGVNMENPGDDNANGTYSLSYWFLNDPATGANNVIVTFAAPVVDALCLSASYTGNSGHDGTNDGEKTGSSATASISSTASVNNVLVVASVLTSVTGTAITPSAGNDRIQVTQGSIRMDINDKLVNTAGAYTMSATVGNGAWNIIQQPLVPTGIGIMNLKTGWWGDL